MKIEIVRVYKDVELGRMTKIGEVQETTPQRAAKLISLGYAVEVKEGEREPKKRTDKG